MMNVKLLAASALLVQSGVLPVFFNQFVLQLSNVKPTHVCSAPAGRPSFLNNTGGTSKGIMTSILPLITRTKAYPAVTCTKIGSQQYLTKGSSH
jgi:hypothetical protein